MPKEQTFVNIVCIQVEQKIENAKLLFNIINRLNKFFKSKICSDLREC